MNLDVRLYRESPRNDEKNKKSPLKIKHWLEYF